MTLTINGEPREVPEGITVERLLSMLEVRAERLAVEVNQEIVRRARHPEHRLHAGDRVEIVTFVGGG
ncbi:MAG: sulfur carrier protein ThiS [Myxococcales bacterium]|nr:sulfur carrier protein ThiS [Myxococcales bacterium]